MYLAQIPKGAKRSDEIKSRRSLNAKHFSLGGNKKVMNAHVGHIHYFNKLGKGDGEKRYREIDFNLNWDDQKRGWYFEYHSFNPFLPEYADEWIEFRDLFEGKDQTIKYRPLASHVKGRLISVENLKTEGLSKLTGSNCVIYDNAFGQGVDLILYFTRNALQKVVRIRDGFKPTNGANYDFEIEYPKDELQKELTVKRALNKKLIAYELDLKKDKEVDTNKQTLIGNDQLNGKEWYTYLRSFKVWDNKNEQTIKVKFYTKGGKRYISKIITKEFIDNSVGDIFTDVATSYYVGAGDGFVGTSQNDYHTTWDASHDASTGDYDNYTNTTAFVNSESSGVDSFFFIYRAFFPTDTSALPTAAVISAVEFKVYCQSRKLEDNDAHGYIHLVGETSQASNTELVEDDYDQCGAVDSPTEGATKIGIGSFTLGAYNTFTFTATGRGWIDPDGYTLFGLREGHDVDDDQISTNDENEIVVRTSEYTGTSSDPYLSITYTEPINKTYTLRYRIDGEATPSEVGITKSLRYKVGQGVEEDVETFEVGIGGYTNGAGDFNWTRDSGGTPSTDTGPSAAHGGSYYMYTEASGQYPSKIAYLEYDLGSAMSGNVEFWWHMNGNYLAGDYMGTLEVQAYIDSVWTTIWTKSGNQQEDQTDPFEYAKANFGNATKIRFKGTTGSHATYGWCSDMAIDDVTINSVAEIGEVIFKSLEYQISTGPSEVAIEKSLAYEVTSTPSAITKSLSYEVTATPTAPTKSLAYEVTNNVTPTKSLTYEVTVTASAITKGLIYEVTIEQAAITKSLAYEVLKAIGITKSLQYIVVNDVAVTKTLIYEILSTPSAITKSLTYEILTTPSAITKSLAYEILTSTAPTKSLAYEVTNQVTPTKSLEYQVFTTPSAITKGLIYRVTITPAAITKSLQYVAQIGGATIEKTLEYEVTSTPSAPTKSLTYEVTADIAITKSLAYEVTATPSAITKALVYEVTATASAITKTLIYEVTITASAITKSLIYEVTDTPAAITKSLEYEVTDTPSAITKSLAYEVTAEVPITKSLTYEIIGDISITKSLGYAVLTTPTATTKSLQYILTSTPAAIEKGLIYEILSDVAITKSLEYVIEGFRVIELSLIYRVAVPTAITKQLIYSVVLRKTTRDIGVLTTQQPQGILNTIERPIILKTTKKDKNVVLLNQSDRHILMSSENNKTIL